MSMKEKENNETHERGIEHNAQDQPPVAPPVAEEITIEELAVDGICGIY